ncbi:MAG TPA: DNA mismatch repair endonuclease MutL [Ruminococcaceae bacterium]|nr:DNA mismatch repair endonuclease MutL [Oscillospiraceae bacterium]
MPTIKVLDKQTAEMIAAGEVVERPASVVKELVENAVDAGAKSITAEIKNGGVTYIRISDDGAGISADELPTAFLRHATSKISSPEDLDAIGTLGFRGEALASVAAVAKVSFLTRTAENEEGVLYEIMGGEETGMREAGCPVGSTITVRDLFYNLPARMKFLKKDQTEANAVAGVIDRLALSHPEVAFTFIKDGKQTLKTPGDGRLISAIHAVYGGEFAKSLIPLEYANGSFRAEGYISKPSGSRKNRNMQHFYINGRYVKTRTAMAALEQAYKNAIMAGKFPACVLNITVPMQAVDVNVHPAKTEVRFADEKPVFDVVYYGVKSALNAGDRRPELTLKENSGAREAPLSINKEAPSSAHILPPPEIKPDDTRENPGRGDESPGRTPATPAPREIYTPVLPFSGDDTSQSVASFSGVRYRSGKGANIDIFVDEDIVLPDKAYPAEQEKRSAIPKTPELSPFYDGVNENTFTPLERPDLREESPPPEQRLDFATDEPKLIGEVFGTYILAEKSGTLYIIDKHAAHERILFEQLKANRREAHVQLLLSPAVVTLSKEEYDALLQNTVLLEDAGFEIEDFDGSILVRGVPSMAEDLEINALIQEIAGKLMAKEREISTEGLDFIFHSVACRAAVKAGDRLTPGEMLTLAKQVLCEDSIRYCPHGRPVCYELGKKEIEKQFGRIQ